MCQFSNTLMLRKQISLDSRNSSVHLSVSLSVYFQPFRILLLPCQKCALEFGSESEVFYHRNNNSWIAHVQTDLSFHLLLSLLRIAGQLCQVCPAHPVNTRQILLACHVKVNKFENYSGNRFTYNSRIFDFSTTLGPAPIHVHL